MTDNIRLIYNKIENRIDEICNDGFVLKENQQEYETLTDLEDFIDSLPKESGCEVNCTTKNEDLEEEIQRAYYDKSLYDADNLDRQDFNNIAHHFAEWQKHQMKEALQTEYEKGRFDMREEMIKEAIDATILDIDAQTIEFGLWPEKLLDMKEGDKVKIIIVKDN